MDLLIQAGADLNARVTLRRPIVNRTALYQAVVNGDKKCFDLLVKAGANVNKYVHYQGTPVCEAARPQNRYYIKALMEAGANTEAAITCAVSCGDNCSLATIIQAGAYVNMNMYSHRSLLHLVKYSIHMLAHRTMLYSLLPNCLIMS